jgi:hypothetical protein
MKKKFKSEVDPLATDYRSCAIRALEHVNLFENPLVRNGLANYAAFAMVAHATQETRKA